MALRGARGLLYSIAFFGCLGYVFLRYHISPSTIDPVQLQSIMGKPLEKVDVDYKRNIHFSVKTSVKNYRTRLSLLLLTWFQAVDKDQVVYELPRVCILHVYRVCFMLAFHCV